MISYNSVQMISFYEKLWFYVVFPGLVLQVFEEKLSHRQITSRTPEPVSLVSKVRLLSHRGPRARVQLLAGRSQDSEAQGPVQDLLQVDVESQLVPPHPSPSSGIGRERGLYLNELIFFVESKEMSIIRVGLYV